MLIKAVMSVYTLSCIIDVGQQVSQRDSEWVNGPADYDLFSVKNGKQFNKIATIHSLLWLKQSNFSCSKYLMQS